MGACRVSEPALQYGEVKMKFSPPPMEEELADSITGDELLEDILQYIDELFKKK
ncbi:MAG: hypothetical protein LUD15_12360 [Bacteroides sp.]|nr:hypothetical protein [Bacteroides sp.]MCD8262752.1 hypothetical protein [Tannerellaceae bacterium]